MRDRLERMALFYTFVSGLIVGLIALLARPPAGDEPITRMINFASQQAGRFNQTAAEDLQLKEYQKFVDSACVQSTDIDGARASLAAQLSSLPSAVIAEIVTMALTPGVSVETARQNMSNTVSESGEVFVYMYYVNTRHAAGEYTSCVLASGIRLVIGEVIVGSVEERSTEIVGYQPCHCGVFFSCEKCPIIRETTTLRPVFQRHTGTIDWHTKLHSLLARMVAQQVGALKSDGAQALPWTPTFHETRDMPQQTVNHK